jgi:hypothetical protein
VLSTRATDNQTTAALLRRRAALGLSVAPNELMMVDHEGHAYAPGDVSLALRRARSTRISIDGNAHFCRGLLRTRYPEADHAETAAFVPLSEIAVTH